MKKILLLWSIFFTLSGLQAAEGDTTHLRVHDDVHMDWNGNFDSLATFPDDGKTYRKILMKYTLGCPTNGCSDWDYTTKIRMRETTPTDTFWVELGRLITPYAAGFPDEWEQAHWYDITDYAPILKGDKLLRARYDGWQDGFTVTLDFYFIEGTPPRDPKRVQTLYDGSFQYGRPNNPIESKLTPFNFQLQGDEEQAALHFTPTGHSFGGKENCAEFCQKSYYVKLNGNQVDQQLIWDDNCGNNPLYPQPGTWLYNRANWCPGARGHRYVHNFNTGLVSGQNEIDVDMEPFVFDASHPPAGGTNPNPIYIMYGGLITYGDWNFQNDVELLEILAPNDDFNYNRMNPICANPVVKIRNSGGATLTSATIEYWIEGGNKFTHEWTGSLEPMEEEVVEIDSWEYFSERTGTANTFYAKVGEPNGVADEYDQNNQLSAAFDVPDMIEGEFFVWWKSNAAAAETSWKLEDVSGNIVEQSTAMTPNETRRDTLQLEQGCYTFTLEDSQCDGLSFFANNDGSGYARIHGMDMSILHQFNSNFGCKSEFTFTVGFAVGTEEVTPKDIVNIFPNPASNQLSLEVFREHTTALKAEIFSITGTLMQQEQLGNLNGTSTSIDISNLASGMYLIRLSGEGLEHSERFIKK